MRVCGTYVLGLPSKSYFTSSLPDIVVIYA